MSEYLTEIDAFDPTGLNLYSLATPVIPILGDGTTLVSQTGIGFIVNGIAANTGMVRISPIIPSNGTFTISFDARSTSAPSPGITLDINDTVTVAVPLLTTMQHFSFTVTVTNYTSAGYDFIDINWLQDQDYEFSNFVVEYGSVETVWSTQLLGRNLLANTANFYPVVSAGYDYLPAPVVSNNLAGELPYINILWTSAMPDADYYFWNQPTIPLDTTSSYTFSLEYRSSHPVNMWARSDHPNDMTSKTLTAAGVWTRVSLSTPFPMAGQGTSLFGFTWLGQPAGAFIDVRRIKIEAGTTATAWSPAPEDNAIGFVRKLCFSMSGCIAGGRYYEPRILNPGSLKMMMFSDGTTMGASQVGYGEVSLVNTDGGLDYLLDAGIGGRQILIKQLIAGTAVLLMSCSTEQPTFNNDTLNIRIKDPQMVLNVPVQPNKYGGTNVLPDGIDGVADISGRPKPLLFGQVSNASPVCVNTSRLIYQLHDGALQSITHVYDKGVSLVAGATYASVADMQANPPSPGEYRVYLAGGLFRLGSSPFGVVTADAVQGTTYYDRSAPSVALQILSKISFTDYDSASFAALELLNNSTVGIYITDETTVPVALDEVLNSIGAWYGFDSENILHVGRLAAPVGSPVADLTSDEILSLDRLATQDEGRGVPVWKVNVNYNKNFTVQDAASLAGSVSPGWKDGGVISAGVDSIAFGNGIFVAVCSGSYVSRSDDGINWNSSLSTTNWVNAVYGNGVFLAINSAARNQIGWDVTGGFGPYYTAPIAAGKIVFCNGTFFMLPVSGSTAYKSSTGLNGSWTEITLPTISAGSCWVSVAYGTNPSGTGVYVAISGYVSGASNVSGTSSDGVAWTPRTMPVSVGWSKVIYGNGIFIAFHNFSSNNGFYTSVDGINWTVRYMPSSEKWQNPIFGDGFFIVSGKDSTKTSAISPDGVTWSLISMPSPFTWSGSAYGAGKFVAGNSVGYAPYLSVTPDSLHSIFASKEYRVASASDATIKTAYPNASEITINTLLTAASDAFSESTRQCSLRKVRRDYISVRVKRSALTTTPDLGRIARITYPRYGYDAGKLFVVIGFEMLLDTDDLILQLWG